MKHSLLKIIAPVVIAASISACGIADISMPPEPKLSDGFSCNCTVSAAITPPGDDNRQETVFSFSGKLSCLGTGFYELELSAPETVSGMKISSRDGDISSALGDLTLDLTAENVPQSSPVYALFNSFDNMAAAFENGAELVSGDNGGWAYQCDGISAVFDGNGFITSMAIASPKLTAEFTDFELLENIPETTSNETSEISSETTSVTTAEITTASVPETTLPIAAVSETETSSQTTLNPDTTSPTAAME